MKKFTFLGACLLTVQILQAQAVGLDSSFAQNGYVQTSISSGSGNEMTFEITTDQQLILAGNTRVGQQMYFSLQKYSLGGDSIGGYFIPVNNSNYISRTAMKLTPEGDLLIADLGAKHGIIKFDPNGQLDSTFGTNGHAVVFYNRINEIIVTQDNRMVAIGENLNDYMGVLKGSYVLAFDMNGQLDTTFADHGKFRYILDDYGFFNRIQELPDGKLLVAGCSVLGGTGTFHTLVKLLPTGVRDSSFGINGVVEDMFVGGGENLGLIVQPDQKIVVCGDIYNPRQACIARYLPNGSLDASFGIDGIMYIPEIQQATDLLMLPNGKLLIYGWRRDAVDRSALVQLEPDGTRDMYFGTNGVFFSPLVNFSPPARMRLVDDNKIIATGEIRYYTTNSVATYLQLQGFVLDMNVGVVEPQGSSSVWAYPNPVRDAFEVTFSLETAQDLQFDLYDLQGRLVQKILQKTAFETGNHTVPVTLINGLPAGSYRLILSSGGQPAATVQIVKN